MEQIIGTAASYPHHLPKEKRSEIIPDLVTTKFVGSPLSDRLILAHMKAGNIIIKPFGENNLTSSSYDLSLGRFYFEEQPPLKGDLFNPYSQKHIDRVWGTQWLEAQKAENFFERFPNPESWENIAPEDEIILVEPGKTYLCHTEQFIGIRNIGTTMMKARSTIGRDFIEVCKCAGWGDNGYISRWTMEITNNNLDYPIPLIVGTRIAQLVFFYTGETDRPYPKKGNYQNTADFYTLVKDWDQMIMKPKPLTKI